MRKLISLLAILILPACQSGPYSVDTPYYQIPAGSRIVIRQELAIPANQARVYFQYGRRVKQSDVNQYYPHCWFLSWRIADKQQLISPDKFVITHVQYLEEVVQRQTRLLFASSQQRVFLNSDDSIAAIEHKTEMTIESEKNPDIRRLICNQWEDPGDARHVLVSEIRSTLGEFAVLVLKVQP